MNRPVDTLTYADVEAAALADWRLLLSALHTRLRTGDFATGLALVNAVGAAAEEMDHHPDLDLRYGHVDVRLSSHDAGGVTERDVTLARRISELAAGLGVAADLGAVQVLELGLDTPDHGAVRPFWQAVLGSEHGGDDEVVDPTGVLPSLWFQATDSQAADRQRFHLDLTVPPEVAGERIAAGVAAGGRLVSDAEAPAFTVLEDADGNKMCVCTSLGRDE
jgi:4a-hydroxytetrahydrobiopterin dehydratase